MWCGSDSSVSVIDLLLQMALQNKNNAINNLVLLKTTTLELEHKQSAPRYLGSPR